MRCGSSWLISKLGVRVSWVWHVATPHTFHASLVCAGFRMVFGAVSHIKLDIVGV